MESFHLNFLPSYQFVSSNKRRIKYISSKRCYMFVEKFEQICTKHIDYVIITITSITRSYECIVDL